MKTCTHCGQQFGPRNNREGKAFLTRLYCSPACAKLALTQRALDDFPNRKTVTADGCWEWTGCLSSNGYGNFNTQAFGTKLAHRISYMLTHGRDSLPAEKHLDHLCRNRACINPDHLEPVEPAENTRRGLMSYAIRTKCKSGRHDITDEANITTSHGRRTCAGCVKERRRSKADRTPGQFPRGGAL